MNNILVPLGTSSTAHETLQYAIDFASDFGANVYIMDVFNFSTGAGALGKVEEKVVQSSKERAKELVAKVDSKGLDIKIASYNGEIVDGLKELKQELNIDLIILAPRSNEVNEEVYLGNTTGKIVKQTNVPVLIIPQGTTYKPLKNILVAFKSGVLKRSKILHPIVSIKNKFQSQIELLFVKTPGYDEEDLQINTALLDLSRNLTITENQTTYLGVLEHFQSKHPDMLCVFRRKRGFFKKLWEKSTILKSEFYAPIPVLVLSVKKY
ncbi:universal stress protein [Croceivirga thetidis]|uniref:Universal stress protein n=1 Tax=Croceivirga thetidis TaxID=2721623 RepID=A0ABX1GP02_9FLAO|nr:universal stress protein [Croceivirga thetidis]NKI31364.1 universal stress protein [Croceivirga thetidis]